MFLVTDDHGKTRLLTWCRDNHSVLLADLFAEADLATAQFHGPEGRPVPPPVVISDRTLWISFEGAPTPPR